MEEALNRRALLAMATLRMLPPALGRLHPRFGTPAAAICANASLVALATLCHPPLPRSWTVPGQCLDTS